MSYLIYSLNIALILLIIILCYRPISAELRSYFVLGLFLKLISGMIYGKVFMEYYGYGDTMNYYHEGIKLSSYGKENIVSYLEFVLQNKDEKKLKLEYSSAANPRSLWIVKFSSVFLLIDSNNYWLTSCYLSLISFLGTFYLMKILYKVYFEYKEVLLISFLFFPSFVFWSSGLSKESVATGSLFFIIAFAIKLIKRLKITWWEIAIFPILFWFLLQLRSFYLIVFMLTFGLYAIIAGINQIIKSKIISWLVASGALLILIMGITKLHYILSINNFLEHLFFAYDANLLGNPGNSIRYFDLKPEVKSILINAPLAIFSGLFRPSLIDAKKAIMIYPALENLFLLLLFITKLPSLLKKWDLFNAISWLYILAFALFLALSTPNFGSLTRYKVAFLPLLLFLLLKDNPLLMNGRWRKEKREKKKDCIYED